jgi:hypothetical protein
MLCPRPALSHGSLSWLLVLAPRRLVAVVVVHRKRSPLVDHDSTVCPDCRQSRSSHCYVPSFTNLKLVLNLGSM